MAKRESNNATKTSDDAMRVTSACVTIVNDESSVTARLPDEVLLVPWGWAQSSNGTFLVDAEAAKALVEAFGRQGTDLVIDYEHQSLGGRYASPNGLAPAAGWIGDLYVKDGEGIWGRVRWTPTAARWILRREYRYLSPVVIVRKSDRRVVALDSVGLTNRPAIAGMKPVVNRRDESASHSKQAQSQEARQMEEALGELRKLLSLGDKASGEEVIQAACKRMTELLEQARHQEAEEKVANAMQVGKIAESQRQWAVRYAMRDPEGYEAWLKDAPVVVPMQRIVVEQNESAGDGSGERRAVVAAARAEWQENTILQRLTSERAHMNAALQETDMELLGADEWNGRL